MSDLRALTPTGKFAAEEEGGSSRRRARSLSNAQTLADLEPDHRLEEEPSHSPQNDPDMFESNENLEDFDGTPTPSDSEPSDDEMEAEEEWAEVRSRLSMDLDEVEGGERGGCCAQGATGVCRNSRSVLDSVRALLAIKTYRYLLAAMSGLYFTVTGVQYWGTKYMLISLHSPRALVSLIFILVAATGPTLVRLFLFCANPSLTL